MVKADSKIASKKLVFFLSFVEFTHTDRHKPININYFGRSEFPVTQNRNSTRLQFKRNKEPKGGRHS